MKLTAAVATGDVSALKTVKSLLMNPVLISADPPFVIPLEVKQHSQTGRAQVAQIPVITAGEGGKQFKTDTVAPEPWQWTLKGYIPGSQFELTNKFTPVVYFNTLLLKTAYKKGSHMIYKDIDCWIYKDVVIESLSINIQNDCRNKTPFQMTLREIVEIKSELADLTETEQAASPEGSVSDAGTTTTEDMTSLKSTLYTILIE